MQGEQEQLIKKIMKGQYAGKSFFGSSVQI